MKKSVNHTIRTSLLCLILLSTVACQTQKPAKQAPRNSAAVEQEAIKEKQRKQREIEQLKLCQEQLGALRNISPKQYHQYKQAFDSLMSGASQYASLRTRVNDNTQETVDALYRYKVSYLCANINQAVLTGLAERGEQIK